MPRPTVDIEQKLPEIRALLEVYNGLPSQTADRKGYAMLTRYLKKYSEHPEVIKLIGEYEINFNGRRSKNDIDKIIEELRDILEKYNGIPSQTVDRVAYARVKYYAKRHADNPPIKALLEEFNVNIGEGKGLDFETFYNKIKTELEIEGRIPAVKDNQTLYSSVKYFFKKFARNPEVEKLKWIYAHSSCYPLAESKENRPEFQTNAIYIGCVPAYTKWKHDASLEYILYVFQKYKELPAPNSKPMEELKYTINKWYRYQDRGKENLKNYLETLIGLGCNEPFILEAYDTFDFDCDENVSSINKLLIEHGACTIHYLAHKIKPGKVYPEDFVLYYFYNMMNDTPEYRKINGLGELFYSSDGSTPIYVHYRLLNQCNVNAIRDRVKNNPRNWKENPPETIEEWEQYGEYRFFIPSPRSDWNYEAYDNFDLSFPEKAIENGHPYFRYYKHGLKFLDYKLFLKGLGKDLTSLKEKYLFKELTPLSLCEEFSLKLKEDVISAYQLAYLEPDCIIDSEGGIYYEGDLGLKLIFIPLNAKHYKVRKETTQIAQNAFRTSEETLISVSFGPYIERLSQVMNPSFTLNNCLKLEKIIIPEEKKTKYCFLFPKRCTSIFYNESNAKIKTDPIIEEHELKWVPYIKEYEVPESVTKISQDAFKNCPLESLIISGSVEEIKGGTFYSTETLLKVEIKEGTKTLTGATFGNCKNLINVELPKSLNKLEGTFEKCTSLKTIHLYGNVEYIGSNTFKDCTSLENFRIEGHLKELGSYLFSGCKNLKVLEFNYGIENLGDAIDNCENLEYVYFRGEFQNITSHYLNFWGCRNLKAIYVPENYYDLFASKILGSKKNLLKIEH